jgi:hypothetical protein
MNVPSTRTRHDMEIAADLRAQGGTWATIAPKLKSQPALLFLRTLRSLRLAGDDDFNRRGRSGRRTALRVSLFRFRLVFPVTIHNASVHWAMPRLDPFQ